MSAEHMRLGACGPAGIWTAGCRGSARVSERRPPPFAKPLPPPLHLRPPPLSPQAAPGPAAARDPAPVCTPPEPEPAPPRTPTSLCKAPPSSPPPETPPPATTTPLPTGGSRAGGGPGPGAGPGPGGGPGPGAGLHPTRARVSSPSYMSCHYARRPRSAGSDLGGSQIGYRSTAFLPADPAQHSHPLHGSPVPCLE
jgi:hypothetical protein